MSFQKIQDTISFYHDKGQRRVMAALFSKTGVQAGLAVESSEVLVQVESLALSLAIPVVRALESGQYQDFFPALVFHSAF
jgi:hypothetical protein